MSYDYLKSYEAEFNAAEQAPDYSTPPVGRYNAILTETRLFEPKPEKPIPRLSIDWVIMDGSYKGAHLFMNYNITPQGAPYLKQFHARLGFGSNATLSQIVDALPRYVGKTAVLSVQTQKNNPQYTNTYLDQVTGMGNVSDYLKPKAAAPNAVAGNAADQFTPVDDSEDLPF